MKKIFAIFATIMMLTGCSASVTSDGAKFKEEYESYNGQKNKRDQEYLKVSIDKENPVVYATVDEILEVLDNDGVIYFGFPTCPWCRNAAPVLVETAKELGLEKLYYYNGQEMRDSLKLEADGTITVEKEKGEDYQKIYDKLYDSLSVYDGLNDDTIKRLYFPTVVFVKDGEVILFHEGSVDSQDDASIPLTDEQKKELHDIYAQGINEVLATFCDTEKKC